VRRRATVPGLLVLLLLGSFIAVPGCSGGSSVSTASNTSASIASSSASVPAAESTTTVSKPAPRVRIGALLPLTGNLSAQGLDSLKGMQFAVNQVNAAGGISSLDGARLDLVVGDTQGDSGVAVREMDRLIEEDHVVALVNCLQSTVALRVTAAAEQARVPVVVAFAAADEITERGLAFTFRLCPKTEWYARDQVRFLVELRWKGQVVVDEVALVYESGVFGRGTAEAQKKYLAQAGIRVVKEVAYPADTADLSREMLQIKLGEADAVLTATYLEDALVIADSAAAVRLNLPIIDVGGGFLDSGFCSHLGTKAEGLLAVMDYSPGTTAKALEESFQKTYKTSPTAGAVYGHQAVWLLVDALERASSAEPQLVQEALADTVMPSGAHMMLPQPVLMFDRGGQNMLAHLFVGQVQEGRYVPVWPAPYAVGGFRAAP
jgi:branched-chain amino acid transport system substrate-binding protein